MTTENRKTLKAYELSDYLIRKLDKAFSSTRFYQCTEDLQGADFKVGQVMSEMDWLVWAIEDRYTCADTDPSEMAKFLLDNVPNKLIDWICDFWELNIVEVTAQPRFYYIDEIAGPDDEEYQAYDDEADFFEGMLWNRDVAKEYGDKVPPIKELKELFTMNANAESESINGAHFVKLTTMTIEEYMENGL
jgi:hypothetical protein